MPHLKSQPRERKVKREIARQNARIVSETPHLEFQMQGLQTKRPESGTGRRKKGMSNGGCFGRKKFAIQNAAPERHKYSGYAAGEIMGMSRLALEQFWL
jgi:hypothetical protein